MTTKARNIAGLVSVELDIQVLGYLPKKVISGHIDLNLAYWWFYNRVAATGYNSTSSEWRLSSFHIFVFHCLDDLGFPDSCEMKSHGSFEFTFFAIAKDAE